MMKKRIGATVSILLSASLLFSGCSYLSNDSEEKIVDSGSGDTETANLIPSENSESYKILRPTSGDELRGYINHGVDNRIDVDHMEMGLMQLSKGVFSPDDYVFQSGQYLSQDLIDSMLYREGQEKEQEDGSKLKGLNPPLGKGKNKVEQEKASPKRLNYVLEQDYLKKGKDDKYKLAGVSLAVSLNSVFAGRISDEKGNYHEVVQPLDVEEVKQWGKEIADDVLQRVRSVDGLKEVPVFLTLYMNPAPDSIVPGYFYATAEASSGSSKLSSWKTVDEQQVVFSGTDEPAEKYKSDYDKFKRFSDDVEKYYPEFTTPIAKAQYLNDELRDLTITIDVKFYDTTEIFSFTNYVASLVNNRFRFSRDIPVHIYITSGGGARQEALIERKSDMDKPYVHIYSR